MRFLEEKDHRVNQDRPESLDLMVLTVFLAVMGSLDFLDLLETLEKEDLKDDLDSQGFGENLDSKEGVDDATTVRDRGSNLAIMRSSYKIINDSFPHQGIVVFIWWLRDSSRKIHCFANRTGQKLYQRENSVFR